MRPSFRLAEEMGVELAACRLLLRTVQTTAKIKSRLKRFQNRVRGAEIVGFLLVTHTVPGSVHLRHAWIFRERAPVSIQEVPVERIERASTFTRLLFHLVRT